MKKFCAVGKNVFVKEIEQETKVGDFIIPDSNNVDFTIGEVVSVSGGYYENGMFIACHFVIGDVIAFPKVVGTKVTFNIEKVSRVMMTEVVAVDKD